MSKTEIRVVTKLPGQPAIETKIVEDLETLQEIVGGLIEIVRDAALPGVQMVIDERGKLKGAAPNLLLGDDVVLGPVLFAGKTNAAGYLTGLSKAQVKAVCDYCADRAHETEPDRKPLSSKAKVVMLG